MPQSPSPERRPRRDLEAQHLALRAHNRGRNGGALSGDVSANGDADRTGCWCTRRQLRILVLTKQVGYRAGAGQRIPEIVAVDDDRLVVEEASFAADSGNAVKLYAVSGLARGDRCQPGGEPVDGACLVLGPCSWRISSRGHVGCNGARVTGQPAARQLRGHGADRSRPWRHQISLISDDNFGPLQTTRC